MIYGFLENGGQRRICRGDVGELVDDKDKPLFPGEVGHVSEGRVQESKRK